MNKSVKWLENLRVAVDELIVSEMTELRAYKWSCFTRCAKMAISTFVDVNLKHPKTKAIAHKARNKSKEDEILNYIVNFRNSEDHHEDHGEKVFADYKGPVARMPGIIADGAKNFVISGCWIDGYLIDATVHTDQGRTKIVPGSDFPYLAMDAQFKLLPVHDQHGGTFSPPLHLVPVDQVPEEFFAFYALDWLEDRHVEVNSINRNQLP